MSPAPRGRRTRPALTRAAIIEAAVAVADGGGLSAVSMRNIGRQLGVEAMSLYHHVANKEAVLCGLAETIFELIELPDQNQPWRAAMTERAISVREVLSDHPWALSLLHLRPELGHYASAHHEAVLANLCASGFSLVLAAHAFSAIDSYVHGYVLAETATPGDARALEEFDVYADSVAATLSEEEFPLLRELFALQRDERTFGPDTEFAFGLELVLDGLQRCLDQQ